MYRLARLSVMIGVVASLAATGCAVNFYSGRPSDVQKINDLASTMDKLKKQKDVENQQLREAKELLEDRLRQELASKQVKLQMAERGLVLTFVSEVLFDSGKAVLRPEARETISKVASVIREKVADRDIGVEGHTDDQPIKHSGWKSNWELSTNRATSVLHTLEQFGVSPRQLIAKGYGEYRPVVANDGATGRQQNRRVEIVIEPKKLTRGEREIVRRAETSDEPEISSKAREFEAYK